MNKKLTEQDFINWIEEHNTPIEYLSGYKSTSDHCKVKCLKCGYVWQVKPANIKQGKGCKKCANKSLSKHKTISLEEFNRWLLDNGRTDLECISGYIDTRTKCNFKCTKCGNIWGATPNNIKRNRHCPACSYKLIAEKNSLPKSDFIDYIDRQRKDIKYVSGFKNMITPCTMKCLVCGNVWNTTAPTEIISNGVGCPKCRLPHGEKFITKYLTTNHISYKGQKKFADLYDTDITKPLSYDFYIPSYNLLIEYQGEQHYKPVKFYGGLNRFAKQNLHDDMKRDYAKSHGYSLLEIPYTANTQEKVDKYLSEYLDA